MADEQSVIDSFERCYDVQQDYIRKDEMNHRETWYLLFGGTSMDGIGPSSMRPREYIGRTTDKEVARRHYQECHDNPYSIGSVQIVTDTDYQQAGWLTQWDEIN